MGCSTPGWGGGRVLTRVVPAAARGGAPPPVPIHLGEFPLLVGVTGQRVRGQVADLQAGIVPQEVVERHPAKGRSTQVTGGHTDKPGPSAQGQTRTQSGPGRAARRQHLGATWPPGPPLEGANSSPGATTF